MLSRSGNGAFPDQAALSLRCDFAGRKPKSYETTISTVQDTPQTATWFSEPQLEQERSRNAAQSPPGGSQAVDPGLTSLQVAAQAPRRLTLARTARIKQGRDFQRLRQEGQRLAMGCLVLNWLPVPGAKFSRLGVITAGKVGGAVVRNRARRLLRECFRLHQHDFNGCVDMVLVARPSIAGKGFAEVERDFLTTLRKAKLVS